MKAPEIMTEQVRTVQADEPVAVALELLSAVEARHLPVVNARGELEGILSDRDLRGLLGRYDEDPESFAEAWNTARMPVRTVMTRDPLSVDLEADVEDIVALLVDEKIGALPVVDSEKRVIGIITYIDVLRAWQREHEAIEAPVLLPTRADLQDRARAGRREESAVPAGTFRLGRPEPRAPRPPGRGAAPKKRVAPKKAAAGRAAARGTARQR